eukprot:1711264-Amphidinium_carterae.1
MPMVPLGPAVPHGHAPQQTVLVALHGQVASVPLGPAVPLGQTSVLASQIATHALAEQGSVGLRSELSRMVSETFVSHPLEEPRGLLHECQVSMDSGRGQVALPRLDQRMLEDTNEPHMPTIHENARVDPLTVDDPWTRG